MALNSAKQHLREVMRPEWMLHYGAGMPILKERFKKAGKALNRLMGEGLIDQEELLDLLHEIGMMDCITWTDGENFDIDCTSLQLVAVTAAVAARLEYKRSALL